MARRRISKRGSGGNKPLHRVLKVTSEGKTADVKILPRAEFWKRMVDTEGLTAVRAMHDIALQATAQAFSLSPKVRKKLSAEFKRIETNRKEHSGLGAATEFNNALREADDFNGAVRAALPLKQRLFYQYFFIQLSRIYLGVK